MENNLFFFSVLDLWPLPAPRLAHSTSKSIVFPLDRGLAEDFLHGIDPANIPLWVTEPLCTVAIRIPAPYVELCLRRLCTSLAWSTVKREHRLFRAPACPDLLAPFVRPELPMVLGHFDDACAYEVAEELRQLASTIDPSTEDGRERLLTLHCLATLLQRTNDSSKHQRGGEGGGASNLSDKCGGLPSYLLASAVLSFRHTGSKQSHRPIAPNFLSIGAFRNSYLLLRRPNRRLGDPLGLNKDSKSCRGHFIIYGSVSLALDEICRSITSSWAGSFSSVSVLRAGGSVRSRSRPGSLVCLGNLCKAKISGTNLQPGHF